MKNPSPTEAKQLSPGDGVILLVGDYDPPHVEYSRAMDALFGRPGISSVWACPLWSPGTNIGRVRDMGAMFCAEYASGTKRMPTLFTVALDLRLAAVGDVLKWCNVHYPSLGFTTASLSPAIPGCDVIIAFAGSPASKGTMLLGKFLPVGDVKGRIRQGSDESRSFMGNVWAYVQENRLYR